jgi:hypothetical protein
MMKEMTISPPTTNMTVDVDWATRGTIGSSGRVPMTICTVTKTKQMAKLIWKKSSYIRF